MKNISKKKKKVILISIVLVAMIFFAIYYFFLPKKYTFYIKENIGELQSVSIDCDDYNTGGIWIYDKEIINELYTALNDVKAAPYYSYGEDDGGKQFAIEFFGEDNKSIFLSASYCNNTYVAYLSSCDNGCGLTHPVWDFIGKFSINKEVGDKLYELVSQKYVENIRNISVSDIEELSESKETDWRRFLQFQYTESEEGEIVRKDKFESEYPARFQIEDKKGYVLVWYYCGIYSGSDGNQYYSDVLQATVYDENGESMDLYDENISEFLEEME